MNKLYSLAINPWVIVGALVVGALLGLNMPVLAQQLGFIGDVYVDLLKMIVLPFMVSAVIVSLQKMLRHGGAGQILKRTCIVFTGVLVVMAAMGILTSVVSHGRSGATAEQVEIYGRIVGRDALSNDTLVALNEVPKEVHADFVETLRASLVPTNVFAALAQGETLKALVFALLFGLAIGNVRVSLAEGLSHSLEAVYQACQRLTTWLNYPLPLVLVCMSAGQLAKTGLAPLQAMTQFIAAFAAASAVVILLSVLVLWRRGGLSMDRTLSWLRAPFALALATRSSAACMPSMIDALSTGLRFPRERVELLVPLGISLLRVGPVLYYTCATLFIAHIYGRTLSVSELALVGAASVLAGCASAGMTGLVTVSLTGMVCGYLGLPFEAAFVLFLAVDPVCDMLRTVVLVLGISSAVALICDQSEASAEPEASEQSNGANGAATASRASPQQLAAALVNKIATSRELA